MPGLARPSRFLPPFHYELLVCGLRGHELIGVDARTLRSVDAVFAREIDGVRWHRCLRCDSWLPVPPGPEPGDEHPPPLEEIQLPLRGRPLRDKIVLRTIAVDRAIHFVILLALAVAVFLIADDQVDLRDRFYAVLSAFHGGLGGPTDGTGGGVAGRIGELLSQPTGRLHLIGVVLAVYAIVEGIEAVGLWMQKRWAEYLTLLATVGLLPLEIYELYERVTALKIVALVVNLAVVAYLLWAKRLFGIRGGVAAEEQLRERDTGWKSLLATSPEVYGRGPRQAGDVPGRGEPQG